MPAVLPKWMFALDTIVSFGLYNTTEEIDVLVDSLKRIVEVF